MYRRQRLLIWFVVGFCMFTSSNTFAQLCDGTLGALLFEEDFGQGPNPGPPLPNGSTSYTYGSIGNGNYTVTNTTGLNGSLWHQAPDHTPNDVDGYMLLFDASNDPGIFFQTTLTGLCANTDYVFSCFATNIVRPSACGGSSQEPNLLFVLLDPSNNAELGRVNTGNIPTTTSLVWNEYAISFRLPLGQTSIRVEVRNNAGGGCGNDLAIDDFRLRLCNPELEQSFNLCDLPGGSITVGGETYTSPGVYETVINLPNSCNDSIVYTTLTGTQVQQPDIQITFCEGDSLLLNGQVYTQSIMIIDTLDATGLCPRYQRYFITAQVPQFLEQTVFLCWGDSIQVGNNWYTTDGVYIDSLLTEFSCDSIIQTEVISAGIEVGVTPRDVLLELGESIELNAQINASGSYSLEWYPEEAFSCNDCPKPLFTPTYSGGYTLYGEDKTSGCMDSVQINVEVLPCTAAYIPNVFSPNFDGINDYFKVYPKACVQSIVSFEVFNRWGGLVYQVQDRPIEDTGWDGLTRGKMAGEGIYVYLINFQMLDGSQVILSGDVLLLR